MENGRSDADTLDAWGELLFEKGAHLE